LLKAESEEVKLKVNFRIGLKYMSGFTGSAGSWLVKHATLAVVSLDTISRFGLSQKRYDRYVVHSTTDCQTVRS